MVNLVISGLPKNVKIPKFVNYLEKTVFHENVNARLLHTMHVDNNIKNITLGLRSNNARKARRFLDGFQYQYAGKEFPLQCWLIDTEDVRQGRDKEEMMDYTSSDDYHNVPESSQNPSMMRRELEEIDLKIEIVKKQRILLEEENKLLLAKKKAELLNKIGPNDYDNLLKLEKVCGLKDLNDVVKLQTTPATNKSPNTNANTNSNANAKKKNNTRLPNFKMPCKVIVKEMQDVLDSYVKPENRELVMSLIFSAIRKRLILVLQGQGFLPAPDIVHLYRVKYPQSTDKDLMEELMETISQSFWPKTPSVDTNDNKNGEVKTKVEDTDVTEVKDENNDNDDDVQIINDDTVTEGKVENKQEPVDKKEVPAGNNEVPIVNNQEPVNNEAEAVKNDQSIQSVDNVDAVVDMDNDLDEWDDNENESESKAENETTEIEQ